MNVPDIAADVTELGDDPDYEARLELGVGDGGSV